VFGWSFIRKSTIWNWLLGVGSGHIPLINDNGNIPLPQLMVHDLDLLSVIQITYNDIQNINLCTNEYFKDHIIFFT
jgi:hypothetical protein